jgi:M6 family metalloprotease-like protein
VQPTPAARLSLAVVLVVLAGALAGSARATGADPNVVTQLRQPDGTTLSARIWGDEYYHGYQTLDGYTVVRDEKDKKWKYAERGAKGRLQASKDVANRGKKPKEKKLRPTREAFNAARAAEGAPALGAPSLAAAPAWAGNDTDLLFIMVDFTDQACTFTPAQMTTNMFGGGASGPGDLDDYFDEISYGNLQFVGNVVGDGGGTTACVHLANNRNFYNNDGSNSDGDDDLVREAIANVDPGVDFSTYDNDNDGTVDALGIIYAGGGAHDGCATGSNVDNLWPHSGGLSNPGPTVSADGTTVNPFIINSEVTYALSNTSNCNQMQTIGLFAHELGHSLGLPDLYDTDVGSANSGVSWWSAMASQYLSTTNNADTPPHYDPWSKAFEGWVTPTVHAAGDRFVQSIERVEDSGEVHQFLSNPGGFEIGGSGEYFLVENRQQVLFDSQLGGCGILVWHLEESQTGNQNGGHTTASHRLVDIDEADGLAELDQNLGPDDGDPFPGSTNNTLFADGTNPNSKLYDGSSSNVRMRVLTTTCATSMQAAFGPNQPPVADAGGPYNTVEGTDVALDATGSSDPDGDAITYEWDLDNDGQFDDSTSATPLFTLVGQDGVFTVGVRVTDAYGESDTDSSSVTVTNVPPSVAIDPIASQPENTAVSVTGVVSDPGWLDPLTASIDWGDGSGQQPLAGVLENVRPDATLSFSAQHTYGDDGIFTVTVCAADDDTVGNCSIALATVTNVPPTATIDESGTVLVNGVPVVIAQAGDPVSLSGRSTDPGSDDLTLTWIWDDGSPDTSTLYLNDPAFNPDPDPSPTINPRDVTDTQSHAFAACLYDVGFRAEDDDTGVSATDTVKVLITGTSAERFSAGYWQNVYRSRKSTPFTDEQLECYLEIATFVSNVFSEVRGASTIPQAFDVLKVGGKTTAEDQFDRQLLAALLNFANGDPDFDELIDTDGNGAGDTAFLQVLQNVEAVRLNAASTKAQIVAAKDLLERINLGQA